MTEWLNCILANPSLIKMLPANHFWMCKKDTFIDALSLTMHYVKPIIRRTHDFNYILITVTYKTCFNRCNAIHFLSLQPTNHSYWGDNQIKGSLMHVTVQESFSSFEPILSPFLLCSRKVLNYLQIKTTNESL